MGEFWANEHEVLRFGLFRKLGIGSELNVPRLADNLEDEEPGPNYVEKEGYCKADSFAFVLFKVLLQSLHYHFEDIHFSVVKMI